MKPKLYLILAQILGLFPASGLWGSKRFADLKFKKCSFPFLYCWITFLFRLLIKFIFFIIFCGYNFSFSPTNSNTASLGCFVTFCTGSIYQALSLYRTKRFVILLQELERYDGTYPGTTPPETWLAKPFLIFNMAFFLSTLVFPVSAIIGMMLMVEEVLQKLDPQLAELNEKYPNYWERVGTVLTTMTVLLLSDVASLFPILQLTYFVKAMEHRLEEIYGAILEHEQTHGSNNSSPSVWSTSSPQSKNYGKSPSWRGIGQQYLDFSRVFSVFLKFSGIHFLLLFPVQILSCVCIVYLATATNIFSRFSYVEYCFWGIMGLGAMRIWSMSELGHRLGKVHGMILQKLIKLERDVSLEDQEKVQHNKCLRIVQSISIRLDASGFFIVRRSNIPSIITALVSYIIVLFQFKSAEPDYTFVVPRNASSEYYGTENLTQT